MIKIILSTFKDERIVLNRYAAAYSRAISYLSVPQLLPPLQRPASALSDGHGAGISEDVLLIRCQWIAKVQLLNTSMVVREK